MHIYFYVSHMLYWFINSRLYIYRVLPHQVWKPALNLFFDVLLVISELEPVFSENLFKRECCWVTTGRGTSLLGSLIFLTCLCNNQLFLHLIMLTFSINGPGYGSLPTNFNVSVPGDLMHLVPCMPALTYICSSEEVSGFPVQFCPVN